MLLYLKDKELFEGGVISQREYQNSYLLANELELKLKDVKKLIVLLVTIIVYIENIIIFVQKIAINENIHTNYRRKRAS